MSKEILQVNQVTARVEDKEILHGVSLDIKKGETHVLMGPNGAGKSTLGYVLTGNPKYQVTQGHIIFNGEDMTETSADKRAESRHVSFISGTAGSTGAFSGELYQKCTGTENRKPCEAVGVQETAPEGDGSITNGAFLCRA